MKALLAALLIAAPAGAEILEQAAASAGAQAAAVTQSRKDVDAVRAASTALLDCWYIAFDEACFWGAHAPSSPWPRDAEYRAEAFIDAFGDPNPNRASLKIECGAFTGYPLAALNDPRRDVFCAYPGAAFFRLDGAAALAEARAERYAPAGDDFYVTAFEVHADVSYVTRAVITVWVKDGGAWKLWRWFKTD